jgi:acyl-CoA synthetase (AMP-forming)/AMP-acid ligase II
MMWFTSSWFNQLVDFDITIFETLQTVLVGGEKLSEEYIRKFIKSFPAIEIINGYGPTENTAFSLTHSIAKNDIKSSIPIGRPLNNRTVYVVNKFGQLVPIGFPGEILLAGEGVGRGYLNQPALTAQKFIPNLFNSKPGERLYKSGDMGKWLPDGTVAYLGRMDSQVKIRGYRIELGEVETAMNGLSEVNSCCLVVKDDINATKKMVAYFIPDQSVFKSKERELYLQLIASWKELYETEYAKTEDAEHIDHEFNIIGWNDSFTGKPIPAEHMHEWLRDIIEEIMIEKPALFSRLVAERV